MLEWLTPIYKARKKLNKLKEEFEDVVLGYTESMKSSVLNKKNPGISIYLHSNENDSQPEMRIGNDESKMSTHHQNEKASNSISNVNINE